MAKIFAVNLMFVWPCVLNMKWFVRPTWCNNYDYDNASTPRPLPR